MAGLTAVSAQSTQYITSNVTVSSSPTAYSVYFAFIGPFADANFAKEATVTSATTFYAGSWGSSSQYPPYYTAQCLIGPDGGIVSLGVGTYAVWIKIAADPETPILLSGPLIVE